MMNILIAHAIFSAYLAVGLVVMYRKFKGDDVDPKFYSPAQGIFAVVLWPFFIFIKF